MSWNLITIIICLLLAMFAAYREYQRDNKANLSWRMAAVLLAIAALACIALTITYTGTISQSSFGKILLTAGFNEDSLPKNDSIFTLDKSIHQQYPKTRLLTGIQDLFKDSSHVSPINIFGYGLDEEELEQLAGRPVIFHSSQIPDGFTAVSWAEKVSSGRALQVQGTYKNSSVKKYKILLKGLNTVLDSATIPARSTTSFNLKTIPKNNGRAIYNLTVLNGKDTLQQEQLPVIIEPSQPLKVLLLSASPDFETKFLKDWLSSKGYGVASRTNITKGKLGQEYINMDKSDLTYVNAALLRKFDVVVGDLSVLKNLDPPESSALQQEVSQKGLGIIIRADSSDKKTSWLQGNFLLNYQAGKQQAPGTLNLPNNYKTARLNLDPVEIIPQNNTQPLITDEHSHLLAGLAISGAGKLVFTTLNNTYTWALAGNQKDYSALWSVLIDKAARKLPQAIQWSVASSLPMVGKPVKLMAESASPLVGVTVDKAAVYPAQNPVIPFQHLYTYWPANPGWQQVIQPNSAPYWWYSWTDRDWLSLQAATKLALTKQYVKNYQAALYAPKQKMQQIRFSVPKIYFYILFLMAVTFLWAESKFFSS